MQIKKDRKGGGSKLTRTQTVTVRLDPKLRYLSELAARKHRRTLSSFIEWAIEESLSRVVLKESSGQTNNHGVSVADEAENLWDVDGADRFAKLALNYPGMLNHDEQLLWKIAREQEFLWKGRTVNNEKTWKVEQSSFRFEEFRMCWEDFESVSRGELEASELSRKYAMRVTALVKSDLAARKKALDRGK